ncbi:MAG TPA: glucokinase [Bradyrhizobium sp.]|nr:glucokinase [Bradyrhizobium sp.]
MTDSRTATNDRVVLADIGGTNARFALMDRGKIGPVQHLRVADFPGKDGVSDALAAFLSSERSAEPPARAVFGVAGPIQNNRVAFTNSDWVVDGAELGKRFGLPCVKLLNDFEALGWSLPALEAADLLALGNQQPLQGAPRLVIGPGTGFGAAGLFLQGPEPVVVVTEAGHATLPATSDREAEVIAELRRRMGHVSIEHVLSGSGIENLYHALAAVDGASVPGRDAAAITKAALDGSCATSRATLDMFCSLLGNVAGNLTLTFCAWGGVFIAGGIVPRFAAHLAATEFRTKFESKGRYEVYLRKVPTSIVMTPDISFIGLKAYAEAAGSATDPRHS